MCEVARQLGFCPLMIEGALTKPNKKNQEKEIWCGDWDVLAICGNVANGAVSKKELNFRSRGTTTPTPSTIEGMGSASGQKESKGKKRK